MKTAKVKRAPKRGIYDKDQIYAILDKEFLCHVAFVQDGLPVVIPMMYGRKNDALYLHGASVSRLISNLAEGVDVCVSLANVSGLVLARSAFHHSMNYESVVIHGKAFLVEESEKEAALYAISEHLIKGRWDECRSPNSTELKATKVIRIEIEAMAAKARTGPPKDDKADYELDIWAGVIPLRTQIDEPLPDPVLASHIELPASVEAYVKEK